MSELPGSQLRHPNPGAVHQGLLGCDLLVDVSASTYYTVSFQPVLNIICSLPIGVLYYGLRIRQRGWFFTILPSGTTALYVRYGPRARSLV